MICKKGSRKRCDPKVHAQNLIFTFYEGFIEMLFAAYLNSQNKLNDTISDVVSNIFGYMIAVLIFTVLPFTYLYLVYLPKNLIKSQRKVDQFGKLYEDLRYWNKISLFYSIIYLARRLVIITIFLNPFLLINPAL